MVLLECKTENRNSQPEHGQPMEKTNCSFYMCFSGVAHCQSQHQSHFLGMNSVLHRQVSLAAVNQIYVLLEAMNGCKKSKGSLKACFENVNNMQFW